MQKTALLYVALIKKHFFFTDPLHYQLFEKKRLTFLSNVEGSNRFQNEKKFLRDFKAL